jgi:lipopolysaccharide transport system ATP-binding protein
MAVSDCAIRVEGLGKKYAIGAVKKRGRRLGEDMFEALGAPIRRAQDLLQGRASAAGLRETFWALKNVSFEIRPGEVVGIIGRNGAGKSTLLKILTRITEPTEGCVDLYGRVGSLLEVGTGFHPELTGRENIYLNGAILGMGRREIGRKFDEIVEFAEISQFIDTPVKHYSSGMYVRLAFSIAAHLEPEILLIDEVLAVGDAQFQKKCLGKMDDVGKQGRTVLFVSHNMGLIQSLCERGIFLQEGAVRADAPITEAVDAYLRTLEQATAQDLAVRTDRKGQGKIRLVGVEVSSGANGASPWLKTGSSARFTFHVSDCFPNLQCSVGLYNQAGQPVAAFISKYPAPGDSRQPEPGATMICEVDELLLLPGRYRMDVSVVGDSRLQDYVEAAAVFDVAEGHVGGRLVQRNKRFSVIMPHRWTVPGR